jgi:hypothetical protein
MKYLKMYEDLNNIDYHLDEVKMIFFDYIDKYDMEELPEDLEEDDTSRPGLYYNIYVDDNKEISLTIYCQSEWVQDWLVGGDNLNKLWKKFDKFIDNSVPKFIERLENAGYDIIYEPPIDFVEEGCIEFKILI